MVRVNKLWCICTTKYKRNANLDSYVHRDGQMSKTKLTKSQMEDTKQLCSTLRMRSCTSSLHLRPSLWYQMHVSDACQMALWHGSALRRGYSLFLLGVLKRGRWEACFPVRLFPRNSDTMVRDIHMVMWLVVQLWTAQGLLFTQLCVHALSSELGLALVCLPMRTVRFGELKWLISLVEDRSWIQTRAQVCPLSHHYASCFNSVIIKSWELLSLIQQTFFEHLLCAGPGVEDTAVNKTYHFTAVQTLKT